MSQIAELGNARYVSLESYRANGAAVRTPVWISAEGSKLYCWTIADTGKVRRIGNDSRVRLAVCTARGDIRGEWVECRARMRDSRADLHKQMRRMRAKYGLLFLLFEWWPRVTRTATVVIEIASLA